MRKIVIILLSLGLCGCATTSFVMPERFWVGVQPQFAYEAEPEMDFGKYRNFTVFAQSKLKDDSGIDPMVEKLILFIIRNQFEVLGYKYVDNLGEADFLISAYYLNEYRQPGGDKEKVEIPEDIPEKTVESFKANYEKLASLKTFNYFQDAKDNWGLALQVEEFEVVEEEPAEKVESERMEVARKTTVGDRPTGQMPEKEEKVGFSVNDRKPKSPQELEAEAEAKRKEKKAKEPQGVYLVFSEVVILDKESQESIWSGKALGTTLESQAVLSAQNLIRNIFWGAERAFPPSRRLREEPIDLKDGSFGFFPHIRTVDGLSFYPVVGKIYIDSPSYVQGLRPGDRITHIDGKSTLNLSFSQFLPGLDKAKGETMSLTVRKKTEIVEAKIIAEDEAVAKESWSKYITQSY